MSTNDTVLLFANGHSGLAVDDSSELMAAFQEAVDRVCAILAEKIVGDGEKITRLVELIVEGAPSDEAAEKVARCVGNSLLVKTAWYGGDPNWGRLADAAGYAQVGIQEDRLDIRYNDVPALIAECKQRAALSGRPSSIRSAFALPWISTWAMQLPTTDVRPQRGLCDSL